MQQLIDEVRALRAELAALRHDNAAIAAARRATWKVLEAASAWHAGAPLVFSAEPPSPGAAQEIPDLPAAGAARGFVVPGLMP